jgi:hypothetical protein
MRHQHSRRLTAALLQAACANVGNQALAYRLQRERDLRMHVARAPALAFAEALTGPSPVVALERRAA